ncbi:MAG: DUF4384 domain-containing protein [Candidatus Thiodiazotropha taylori]|nr:DUF4384 domain-containing protein [Candidatus Thiodiazotropha taylori]
MSEIYDGDSGDVTALSHLWQDRIEEGLRKHRVRVTARLDLALVQEDQATYGDVNRPALEGSGADVVITGRYYVYPASGAQGQDEIELHIRAVSARDGAIVGASRIRERLEGGWQQRAAKVWHNVYHNAMETITGDGMGHGPKLKAKLNLNPACYPTGTAAHVSINTERDVYLYIFSLAADRTATLLYPNRIMPEKKLNTSTLEFPPLPMRQSGRMVLALYPLGMKDTRESIKVVASRDPLDFSFLPIPENQVFSGSEGGDLKRLLSVLALAKSWTESTLSYWVGPGCESDK